MNTYADLYVYMIPELKSCPRPVAIQMLQRAGKRFCERTEAWVEALAAQDITEDDTDYTLAIPYDALIKRLTEVQVDGSVVDVDEYDLVEPYTLRFDTAYPADSTDGLEVTVALVPLLETNELSEVFLDRWGERGIMAYAMWKLLSGDNAWRDPDKAKEYQAQYVTSLNEAKATKEQKHKSGELRVEPRKFV